MRIDVIIPIYNALDYLKSCIDSLYRYTDEKEFNLYLIDDCSTDKGVEQYLNYISSTYNNLYIYKNARNLGFVATVNTAMRLCENDIVLLNSDTEVSPRWLYKMRIAAYSNARIATVTPLTNNGTICSIPNFYEDNDIPKTMSSYLELADIVDRYSIAKYPEVPTGVGFCMFIKKFVLQEVGFLDEEHFGKGYGEEVDFCCRCLEHGYFNIIDDRTFIYHKGSMSFLNEKDDIMEKNALTIQSLYPYYNSAVLNYFDLQPLREVLDSIKLKISLSIKKKNLLFMLHNDFIVGRNHPYGGTELHVKDLIDNLKEVYNCFVITTSGATAYLDVFHENKITTLTFPLDRKIEVNDFYRIDYKRILQSIVSYFEIGLIHIQHFKGNTFDVVDIANENDIPIVFTMHDFHSICPNVNLLYNDTLYCSSIKSKSICQECIKKKYKFNDFLENWQNNFYKQLFQIDRIFVPSAFTKETFIRYFSDAGYSVKILPFEIISHGEFEKKDMLKQVTTTDKKRLRIVIFGRIIQHKGSKIILELLQKDTICDWYIYGSVYEQGILNIKKKNVHICGQYNREDILKILNELNPDLTLDLSICPETFSYVLSESFMANIPVMGSNIGVLSNRIIPGKNGWLLNYPLDTSDILNKLKYLNTYRNEVIELKNSLKKQNNKFVPEMADEYKVIYLKLYQEKVVYTSISDNKIIVSGFSYSDHQRLRDCEKKLMLKQDEFQCLVNHVKEIEKSTSWKILKWVNRNLMWIKRPIKFILYVFKMNN